MRPLHVIKRQRQRHQVGCSGTRDGRSTVEQPGSGPGEHAQHTRGEPGQQSEDGSTAPYCTVLDRTGPGQKVTHPPVYVRSSTLIAQFQTLEVWLSAACNVLTHGSAGCQQPQRTPRGGCKQRRCHKCPRRPGCLQSSRHCASTTSCADQQRQQRSPADRAAARASGGVAGSWWHGSPCCSRE